MQCELLADRQGHKAILAFRAITEAPEGVKISEVAITHKEKTVHVAILIKINNQFADDVLFRQNPIRCQ